MFYNQKFRDQAVKRMLGRGPRPVAEVMEATGVSAPTLYRWVRDSVAGDVNTGSKKDTRRRSFWEQARLVVEADGLSGEELGAFLRSEGLYESDIARWKEELPGQMEKRTAAQQTKSDKKKIKKLESELRRKDKALAEAAALLVLQKKVQEIWGDEDDDTL